ncbi:MAG: SMR family transporter [Levilactobacillus sp.]|jgi:paired small multidrug resistance pump|uniref:DMT family transporter n=1 Tax=Levilactobacillus sp. TaxID=2767919 RepID=UPI00258BC311|nr:SMR family transporter [Levilactobacillus sp.]MCI1553558.1 SMR family transporter [Levilactobacillus sp.]MCI1597947.1 SMR family transporter [Levilactobacillus sp.]MCI1605969.1 SMR family transporter [Levilactobacillus sp.]
MWQHWVTVVLGAVFEVSWVVGFKHATTPWEWLITGIAVYLSFYFLIRASRHIPAGTAYAVFVGLGTLGTTSVGMLAFGEPVSLAKLALIGLLLIGIGGLQFTTKGGH